MSASDRSGRLTLRPHRWFAALYDTLGGPVERGPLGRWRTALIRPLTGRILDLGAGTGANFPLYGSAARIVAVEPDPFMLRRARRRQAAIRGPRIDLCQAVGEALPFRTASFDAVVATLVLCTVTDPERTLHEARRVLRRGGRLYFLEHVRADGLLGWVQDAIRPLWSYFGGGCVVNRRTEDTLRRSGFVLERLTHTRMGLLPVIVGIAQPEPLASDGGSVYPGGDA